MNPNGHIDVGNLLLSSWEKANIMWSKHAVPASDWDNESHDNHVAALQWWLESEGES